MVEESERDYDLLPHDEVIKLRREVEDIKRNPFGSTKEGKELVEVMRRLADSMDHLTGLFQEAAEQMKLEEREAELIGRKLDPLFGQMGELIQQNKSIAKGIIAVADIVKETQSRPRAPQMGYAPMQPGPQIRVEQSNMTRSPMPQSMQGGMTPPMPPPPTTMMGAGPMPPPPIDNPRKRGLFSMGK